MIFYTVLFLFFFQLISEFVEAIYAFGLLRTGIPAEIVSLLLLFSPLVLMVLRREPGGRGLALVGMLALLAGVLGLFLDTRGRMLAMGLGMACFLVYLPARLGELGRQGKDESLRLGAGLTLGLALFILFRAWNSGLYPYDQAWFRAAAIVLAGAGASLLWRQAGREADDRERAGSGVTAGGYVKATGLSIGIVSALGLLYFAFASPNVLARWGGANYLAVLLLVLAALLLFAAGLVFLPWGRWLFRPWVTAVLNGLFIAALMGAILPLQFRFPAGPQGYPLFEPAAPQLAFAALGALAVLSLVVLVDFTQLAGELIAMRPGRRALGAGFGPVMLFLVVMIFGQVSTTAYDYIPVVGPFFRDRFWLVNLALGLGMALPLLLVRNWPQGSWKPLPWGFAAAVAGLGLATVLGAWLAAAKPSPPREGTERLRVLTYNIQQGYSARGSRAPQAQLELMRQIDADIIGLQETDTNRIAGGNADLVRFFADGLGMYSYYGPKVVPGTFGIALLSKYPIEQPRTFYLFSEGEQTAAIQAVIPVGDRRLNVFVTHLGNGGPLVQQEEFLAEAGRQDDVIAMGDFNFRPDSEQYALTVEQLRDAWLSRWPGGADDQGDNPADRIDHVFVTDGFEVRGAGFLRGEQSDHPALVVELGL